MNRSKVLYPIFFAFAIVFGVWLGSVLNFSKKDSTNRSSHQKLYRLLDILDKEYLEGVNTDSIVDLTVQSVLGTLDPHSTYISASNYETTTEEIHGSFYGIGIRFYTYKDTIAITEVLPKGPAEKAGLKNGDRIVAADGLNLSEKNISRDSLIELLRGKANSKVQLDIYRKTQKKSFKTEVQRTRVPIQSVTAAYKLGDDLTYLKIEQFTEDTYIEFEQALNQLSKHTRGALVLDLRDNAGGYVDQAKRIMEDLTPKGTLLYSTKDRTGKEKKFYAKRGKKQNFSRIYVLLNEKSASASEMIAGAIQDNDLGTIVGRRSFGKGLVQVERPLGDGSAVWITVAQYYTPTGRSIQRSYSSGKQAYFAHANSRYLDRINEEDLDKIPDSLRFKTPKGKIVYGGGGVYPDVYVADIEQQQEVSIKSFLRNGFMQFFAFEYIDTHADLFKGYNKDQFIEGYEVTDRLLQRFIDYAYLDLVDIRWENYHEELSLMIKANLARQLYGLDAYYKILSEKDPVIQKVIQLEEIAR